MDVAIYNPCRMAVNFECFMISPIFGGSLMYLMSSWRYSSYKDYNKVDLIICNTVGVTMFPFSIWISTRQIVSNYRMY